jgi:hypothetical protein
VDAFFTFNDQLFDAFQLWIFAECVDDVVEHIKNSRCMGAEPDSSLIGCVLVIHSAINRHESITHFKLYQWHVFERHEALLVLRVSLEEGVEDVLC